MEITETDLLQLATDEERQQYRKLQGIGMHGSLHKSLVRKYASKSLPNPAPANSPPPVSIPHAANACDGGQSGAGPDEEVPTILVPDLNEASRFVGALIRHDQPDNHYTFQTFDDSDRKRGHLARIYHGKGNSAELKRLNAAGAGIFLMINAGDGKGRAEKNVTRVRGVFAREISRLLARRPRVPGRQVHRDASEAGGGIRYRHERRGSTARDAPARLLPHEGPGEAIQGQNCRAA